MSRCCAASCPHGHHSRTTRGPLRGAHLNRIPCWAAGRLQDRPGRPGRREGPRLWAPVVQMSSGLEASVFALDVSGTVSLSSVVWFGLNVVLRDGDDVYRSYFLQHGAM